MRWSIPLLLLTLFCTLPAAASERVTLFAAASMTNALEEVISRFKEAEGIQVNPVYAASSALARQISRGAPADIYISANSKWMDYLQQQGMVEPSNRSNLVLNQLVLVTARNNDAGQIRLDSSLNLESLLDGGRMAMADPDHVPAGIYARQALQSLGLWQQAANRITRSHNVRSALALVERGEAPIGIVYRTDALVSQNVRQVAEFPDDSHEPIEYPVALVTESAEKPSSLAFFRFLQSPEAAEVFHRYGFRNAD